MKVAIYLNSGHKTHRDIQADAIICADGGADFCPHTPHFIVGDMDSITNDKTSKSNKLAFNTNSTQDNKLSSKDCFVSNRNDNFLVQNNNSTIYINSIDIDEYTFDQISLDTVTENESEPNTDQISENGSNQNLNQKSNQPKPNTCKIVFDCHKNFSDGEACVLLAKHLGASHIDFVGVTGGRLDHVLANLNLLLLANSQGISASAKEHDLDIFLVDESAGEFWCETKMGEQISLVNVSDTVIVETSQNLQYPLHDLSLDKHHTRGLSNVALSDSVMIKVTSGKVLLLRNLK